MDLKSGLKVALPAPATGHLRLAFPAAWLQRLVDHPSSTQRPTTTSRWRDTSAPSATKIVHTNENTLSSYPSGRYTSPTTCKNVRYHFGTYYFGPYQAFPRLCARTTASFFTPACIFALNVTWGVFPMHCLSIHYL